MSRRYSIRPVTVTNVPGPAEQTRYEVLRDGQPLFDAQYVIPDGAQARIDREIARTEFNPNPSPLGGLADVLSIDRLEMEANG